MSTLEKLRDYLMRRETTDERETLLAILDALESSPIALATLRAVCAYPITKSADRDDTPTML